MESRRYLKGEKKLTPCFAPHECYFPRKISDGIWKKDGQKGGRKGKEDRISERRMMREEMMEIRRKNTMKHRVKTNR